jgi:hypothetical protein
MTGGQGHPFTFSAEASVDLAKYEELLDLMVRAGFKMAFVGFDTEDVAEVRLLAVSTGDNTYGRASPFRQIVSCDSMVVAIGIFAESAADAKPRLSEA